MPPSAATLERDGRILAGHAAGASVLDLALAEEVDPSVVRRVLRDAGITPSPIRGAVLRRDDLTGGLMRRT